MNYVAIINGFTTFLNGDTVTGDELAVRLARAISEVAKVVRLPVLYLIVGCFIVSIVMIIAGSLTKSSNIKKSGTKVFLTVCGGALLYFCIPVVISLLRHISNILNGG